MAISDKRSAANRTSAKKSTGPDEDREAQIDFVRLFIEDLNPIGAVELRLARIIALDNFHLNRIETAEENIFAYGELGPLGDIVDIEHARVLHGILQAKAFTVNDRAFNNLSLYQECIARKIYRNMTLFCEIQAHRKSGEAAQPQNPTANPNSINRKRR